MSTTSRMTIVYHVPDNINGGDFRVNFNSIVPQLRTTLAVFILDLAIYVGTDHA